MDKQQRNSSATAKAMAWEALPLAPLAGRAPIPAAARPLACQSMSEGPSGPCSRQQYGYLAHYLHAEAGHGCHTMRSNICNTEMDSRTATSPRHTAPYGACSPAGNNPSAGLTSLTPAPSASSSATFVSSPCTRMLLASHAHPLPTAAVPHFHKPTHSQPRTHSHSQGRPLTSAHAPRAALACSRSSTSTAMPSSFFRLGNRFTTSIRYSLVALLSL